MRKTRDTALQTQNEVEFICEIHYGRRFLKAFYSPRLFSENMFFPLGRLNEKES